LTIKGYNTGTDGSDAEGKAKEPPCSVNAPLSRNLHMFTIPEDFQALSFWVFMVASL